MKPKFKFLKHKSASMISFSVFLFCCVINIPINIGKGVQKNTIEVNNVSLEVFKIYLRKFNYQALFSISVLSTDAIRDLLPLIIGIVLNIYLVIVTIRYHKNRTSVTTDETIIFKKTNIKNTKLAFILGMISAFFHINNFCWLILFFILPLEVLLIAGEINALLFDIRHSFSILFLLKFNAKFRNNFIPLMPKFISKSLENKAETNQI